MVVVSMQSGLALLLLCSLLIMPSVAKLSRSKGNYLLEPLRRVSEWSNRVQAKTATQYYSKELSLWNESWPKVVKLKHELSVKYGRSESADRPYALSNSCLDGVLRLVNGLSDFDSWALKSEFSCECFQIAVWVCNFYLSLLLYCSLQLSCLLSCRFFVL